MRKSTLIMAAILLAVSLNNTVFAGLDKVEEKANRGATNMVAFWLEVPYQLVEAFKKNPATGLPVGLGLGVVMIPARLGSGVIDLVTCPAPLPGVGYGPMFEPAINPWIE